jgi:MFS family permease
VARFLGLYYGWRITATLAVTETISWGILYYAFSVFLVPMHDDLGWSVTAMTGAYSLALLVSGLLAPLVGRWLDRRGPRAIMTAGSSVGAISLLAWSRVDSIAGFYVLWAGIGIAMAATLYEPAFATLTHWFSRGRSRALLIVTIAAGFASTIFLPFSSLLVGHLGWRDALLVLAVILGATAIPLHGLVLRRRPEDLGLAIDGGSTSDPVPLPETPSAAAWLPAPHIPVRRLLRDTSFQWLTFAFCVQSFATSAVAVIMIPYLTDRGDDPGFAAAATGLIGAAQVLSRILSTVFGDRISAVVLTAFVFALQAIAVGVLLAWQTTIGILLAVLLLGAGRGAVTLVRATLIAEFYGRSNYGVISGTQALFLTGASGSAPICTGVVYGILGDYAPVLWGMAVLSVISTVAMLRLGQQRRPTGLPVSSLS